MRGRELRDTDLQQLTPHQFEQLTFLLARADDEQTVIVRDRDRGLDARLPDPMGRLTLRGWQSKRFATGEVQWSQCEGSLKTALAFWRPLHVTFVFAHDLSAIEQTEFRTRLVDAFRVVRLDYWSAAEVLKRMRETDEGQRATAWLFDRRGTLDELLASMVDKEPVSGARAIAERQAALNRQFDHDPHLYYTAVVRPHGAPQTPAAPGTVASVVLVMDGQEVRYDMSERYSGALGDAGGGPEIVARDDPAGRTAAEILEAATSATGAVTIEDGLGVLWREVPVGLRGLVPEDPIWGPVELGEVMAGAEPSSTTETLPMLVVSGDAQVGVTFVAADEPDDGWEITLVGATGGFELTQSFRTSQTGIEAMQTRWRHTLGVGPATDQLLSAQLLLGALQGDEIRLEAGDEEGGPRGRAIATIDEHDLDAEAIDDLRVHITFLTYLCEVQAWLGVPLFPPARPSRQDADELGRALALVRKPARVGTWSSIAVVERDQESSVDEGDVAILYPAHVELFGLRHYLGMELMQVRGARIDRSGGQTTLRPGVTDAIWMQLHHPSELPEEAASRYVGEGRGRVLMRSAGDEPATAQ